MARNIGVKSIMRMGAISGRNARWNNFHRARYIHVCGVHWCTCMAQCQVAGCDNPVKSGEVCESCGEKGVVSVEFLTDTATQYISEGLDRERAIAKACNDALERMEERDNAE